MGLPPHRGPVLGGLSVVPSAAVNTKKDSESAPVKGGTMTDLGESEPPGLLSHSCLLS